ncbi:MAG: hypothetical protein QM723_37380 [Myxococcaceae bacterium]
MRKLLLAVTLFCSACYQTPEKTPPASFTTAELVPQRPQDTTKPLAAVIWALNYDLRQFETVWSWLHSEVPAGAERSRALGAAGLIAVAELESIRPVGRGGGGVRRRDSAVSERRAAALLAGVPDLLEGEARG